MNVAEKSSELEQELQELSNAEHITNDDKLDELSNDKYWANDDQMDELLNDEAMVNDVRVEDGVEDLSSLIGNPVDEPISVLHTDAPFTIDNGIPATSEGHDSDEQEAKNAEVLSQLETVAGPVSMNQMPSELETVTVGPGTVNEMPPELGPVTMDMSSINEMPPELGSVTMDTSSINEMPSALEPVTTDPASMSHVPSEVKPITGDPGSVNNVANVSDQNQNGAFEPSEEKENDLADVKLDNGGRILETDTKQVHPEEKFCKEEPLKQERGGGKDPAPVKGSDQDLTPSSHFTEGYGSGTEEEQYDFMRELEKLYRERCMEFKPPRFYGELLNCLKLWRAVTRLGGYDRVTTCKLWRQVGESFKPPKTCTTVSWTFRIFYEKALLEYEKHKVRTGELHIPMSSLPEPMSVEQQVGGNQSRARRDAAARAMKGWHSQRLLGNGEIGDPIIKDKSSVRDKHLKSVGILKRKKTSNMDRAVKAAYTKAIKPQVDVMVVDVGTPADWVKINVKRTKDSFEIYALVPGLLREEVHVQSDPAGRLVISGEPEQADNPWGVTPFKKVVSLPSRIDPHQTSAVVTLHGQLFVRAPYEQSDE